jgi:hypothetical protein
MAIGNPDDFGSFVEIKMSKNDASERTQSRPRSISQWIEHRLARWLARWLQNKPPAQAPWSSSSSSCWEFGSMAVITGLQTCALLNAAPQHAVALSPNSSSSSSSSISSSAVLRGSLLSPFSSSSCFVPLSFSRVKGNSVIITRAAQLSKGVLQGAHGAEEFNNVEGEVTAAEELGRRQLFLGVGTAALTLSLGARVRAEEALSDWEQIPLPIDPGVVLLDLAFVPDEPDHGRLFH